MASYEMYYGRGQPSIDPRALVKGASVATAESSLSLAYPSSGAHSADAVHSLPPMDSLQPPMSSLDRPSESFAPEPHSDRENEAGSPPSPLRPHPTKDLFSPIDWRAKREGRFLARKTAEMICWVWFSSESPRSQATSSASAAQLFPRPAFVNFIHNVLSTTQVSQSVIVVAQYYLWKYRQKEPERQCEEGSEYRGAVAGLMMANKFLDDNTYTNKTWSEVTGIGLTDINEMEHDFLQRMNFELFVSHQSYIGWEKLLTSLVRHKEGILRRHRELHPAARRARRSKRIMRPVERARSMSPPRTPPGSSAVFVDDMSMLPQSRKRAADVVSPPPERRVKMQKTTATAYEEDFGMDGLSIANAGPTLERGFEAPVRYDQPQNLFFYALASSKEEQGRPQQYCYQPRREAQPPPPQHVHRRPAPVPAFETNDQDYPPMAHQDFPMASSSHLSSPTSRRYTLAPPRPYIKIPSHSDSLSHPSSSSHSANSLPFLIPQRSAPGPLLPPAFPRVTQSASASPLEDDVNLPPLHNVPRLVPAIPAPTPHERSTTTVYGPRHVHPAVYSNPAYESSSPMEHDGYIAPNSQGSPYSNQSTYQGSPAAYAQGSPSAYTRGSPAVYAHGSPSGYAHGSTVAYAQGLRGEYSHSSSASYPQGSPAEYMQTPSSNTSPYTSTYPQAGYQQAAAYSHDQQYDDSPYDYSYTYGTQSAQEAQGPSSYPIGHHPRYTEAVVSYGPSYAYWTPPPDAIPASFANAGPSGLAMYEDSPGPRRW
ncbi:hypothetical protein CYLTODRAFT_440526 [Cylindrobasidium torrendii FP15055 ss-10]|uniref:Cyclin-like domain-containing protein n=1 Tax=Cylindrobasidium torrendii FP15055 ss-10 TaxID=1314674 RepID=A0A0D7BQA9_9AGAR|nr:hypothetical protein CYLTODRAFT_440526 [Cylindrobasidium torrendii FP15055 ss-10]